MITKYAIYDARNGENIIYDTKEEAIDAFWAHVISIAKKDFHNTAYMTVQQNEDGTEIWYNDNNNEIERPKTKEEIKELLKGPKISEANETTVEILP
jgi:hypothetical protein